MDAEELLRRYADGERNFVEVDLSRANLSGANLYGADLRNANLSGVDLSGADLRCTRMEGVNLRDANLECADWHCAEMYGAFFCNTILPDGDTVVEPNFIE